MNLNDQYKAAVNFNSIVSDFAAVQLAAAKLSGDADVELFLAESCEDCGNHLPTEGHSERCIERAAERERCGYCGQDVCDCKRRYGVAQGIVSARAKGGR